MVDERTNESHGTTPSHVTVFFGSTISRLVSVLSLRDMAVVAIFLGLDIGTPYTPVAAGCHVLPEASNAIGTCTDTVLGELET